MSTNARNRRNRKRPAQRNATMKTNTNRRVNMKEPAVVPVPSATNPKPKPLPPLTEPIVGDIHDTNEIIRNGLVLLREGETAEVVAGWLLLQHKAVSKRYV